MGNWEGVQLDRAFTDKASGRDVRRPQLDTLMSFVREGDVVCHSMDRLARNLDDLRRLVFSLTKRSVKVQVVKENLTFTGDDSPMANLLLSVMRAFAEFERQLMRETQREGIAAARRAGKYRGRGMANPRRPAWEIGRRLKIKNNRVYDVDPDSSVSPKNSRLPLSFALNWVIIG